MKKMPSIKSAAALLVLMVVGVSTTFAQTEVSRWTGIDFAWYPANLEGYENENFAPVNYDTVDADSLTTVAGDKGRDLGGQGFEAKAVQGQEWKIPFMQGDSPLTLENNIKIRLTGEVTPVSAGAEVRVEVTPLALLSLHGSVLLGTGWTQGENNGLTLNTKDSIKEPMDLGGAIIDADIGTTLQFEVAV